MCRAMTHRSVILYWEMIGGIFLTYILTHLIAMENVFLESSIRFSR